MYKMPRLLYYTALYSCESIFVDIILLLIKKKKNDDFLF